MSPFWQHWSALLFSGALGCLSGSGSGYASERQPACVQTLEIEHGAAGAAFLDAAHNLSRKTCKLAEVLYNSSGGHC